MSRSLSSVRAALLIGAIQVGCTGDLPPLPQSSQASLTNAVMPVRRRLPTSQESAAVLLKRIQSIVGLHPADCGQHLFRRRVLAAYESELVLSLKCSLDAAAVKQPFWTFAEHPGTDSWLASGMFGGSDGAIKYFSYDSSPGGDPYDDSRFRLTISP